MEINSSKVQLYNARNPTTVREPKTNSRQSIYTFNMKVLNTLFLILSCVAVFHIRHTVAAPILGYPVDRSSSEGKATLHSSPLNLPTY